MADRIAPYLMMVSLVLFAACAEDGDTSSSVEAENNNGSGDEGDDDPDGGDETPVCDQTAAQQEPALTGQVYTDDDESDRSLYTGTFNVAADTPEANLPVTLLGSTGEVGGATCSDGSFAFGGLADGNYLSSVEWPDGVLCQTRNCPHRVPGAAASNSLTLVTAGDSVPVVGSDVLFPERLTELFGAITTVTSTNVAVAGTVSDDWVPGSEYFETRLGPHIQGADVIIVSLGGNDFMRYASEGLTNANAAIDGLPEFIREVMDKLLATIDEIRARNPNVDIVYLLYPDYAQSDLWAQQFGFAISVIQPLVEQALNQILDELPMEEDIVLVDMYGYFAQNADLDVDDYLYDQLHFNDRGHQLWAELIFRTLGGVVVGESPIGLQTNYGLAP